MQRRNFRKDQDRGWFSMSPLFLNPDPAKAYLGKIIFHAWLIDASKVFEDLGLERTLWFRLFIPTHQSDPLPMSEQWAFLTALFCPSIADVGDIQSRLIDHRPVIQGEIRYFVREFEVRNQSWLDSVDIYMKHVKFSVWNRLVNKLKTFARIIRYIVNMICDLDMMTTL